MEGFWLSIEEGFKIFGCVMIVIYLIFGIDDLIWHMWSVVSILFHRKRNKDHELDFNTLRNTAPKMLAVSIAAWHEANVIGDVITNFINTTDYPKSMYHLFVGVYPNDPETIKAVEDAGKSFPNVHAIVNSEDGPTTKAQNINHVISEIRRFEKENQIQFAALTIHDSEDAIHTYELLTTNYLIDSHDALQFPVFPILEMPRFGNFFRQLTTATYADEFAENHFMTLVQRRDTGAFVPCAGTGFAVSKRVLNQLGDEPLLPSNSLTEDYLLSLNLYKKGISLHYVLNKLPRVIKNGKLKMDFITTRSLFPATFKAAVRQKTRWTYGIAMKSIGIKDIFTPEKISFAGRYSFYKDIKTKFLNLLPLLGYILAIYIIVAAILGLDPFFEKGSIFYYLSIAVFVIMCIRQFTRAYALYSVYGLRSVFFGCLLPPLFPIRLIYGNVINFCAVVGAFKMKLGLGRNKKQKAGNEVKTDIKNEEKKGKESWAKTDHTFLSRDQLRQYRRMLGDVLIIQGYITARQFQDALKNADKEHGEHIGEYLIDHGFITEEQMIRSLSHVKHIQFIPQDVLMRLDYHEVMHGFDVQMLMKNKILPLTMENGTMIIGICNNTKDEDIRRFEEENHIQTRRMYMMEEWMMKAFDTDIRASERLESLSLYHNGSISYEQVILIGKFAMMLSDTENDIRSRMGIMATG